MGVDDNICAVDTRGYCYGRGPDDEEIYSCEDCPHIEPISSKEYYADYADWKKNQQAEQG